VLAGAAAAGERPVVGGVPVLEALAVPERVDGEDDEAAPGERDPDLLVVRVRLAFRGVAGEAHHRRERGRPGLRPVEVGRDVEAGLALVDELVDLVAVPVEGAGEPHVEAARRRRQAADPLEDPRPDPALVVGDLGSGVDGGDARVADVVPDALGLRGEVVVGHRGEAAGGQHLQRACRRHPRAGDAEQKRCTQRGYGRAFHRSVSWPVAALA
jgi:hypothetical protein